MYNKLLERQIRRYLKDQADFSPELKQLLTAVSQAYEFNGEDRKLIERSLELSTAELNEANRNLREAKNQIETKSNELLSSIRYAKMIQDSMLANEGSLTSLFPNSFVFAKPKDIVSGDFYWLYQTEAKTYVASVDCTGHGVPGAFMSVLSYRYLNMAMRERKLQKPSEIIAYLNTEINETMQDKMELSEVKNPLNLAICCLDQNKSQLEFAGIGQKILLIENQELQEFRGDTTQRGQAPDFQHKPFTNQVIDLKPKSTLYMFSDGFQDQFGGVDGKKFGSGRFKELISKTAQLEVKQQADSLETAFYAWKNGFDQVDDTLVLGIQLF